MTETKTILLIGRSGRGKSTLANVITNTNNFKESSGSVSETKKNQFEKFEDVSNKINYAIIDTPGIGDTKMSDSEVLDIIAEAVYLAKDGISQVFFVNDGRFDQHEMATYDLLRTIIFDENITKHTTIVRTRFADFKKSKKCQADIDLMAKEAQAKKTELEKNIADKEGGIKSLSPGSEQYQKMLNELEKAKKELTATNLAEIIESCQGRIVYVDNPSIIIDAADNEDENKKKRREKLMNLNEKARNKSREILLEHLSKVSQGEPYNPANLKELSQEIADDYFQYLKKKEELQKELDEEMKKLSSKISQSSVALQTSSGQSSSIDIPILKDSQTELELGEERQAKVEEKVLIIEKKEHDQIIAELQDKKARLKKEIAEKEKIIHQKVLKHIFNNYEAINKELGGNIFLNSVAGEHPWPEIHSEFANQELVVKWLSQGFDYEQTQNWARALIDFNPQIDADFCAWLRDKKQLAAEGIKRASYPQNIERWRNEYENYLKKETEILGKHSEQLEKKDWIDIHSDFAKETSWSYETCQQEWEKVGLTYQTAQEWIATGFKPNDLREIKQWKNSNFTPQQVKSWIDIGINKDNYEFVAYLKSKGHQPSSDLNLEKLREEFDNWLKKGKPAQEYLDVIYPKSQRKEMTELGIVEKNFQGTLDLSDFVNLEQLVILDNGFTELDISSLVNLKVLACQNNKLTDLILPKSDKLEYLDLGDNNFRQDLFFLSELVGLKELRLVNNNFYGSLEFLKNSNKLERLNIKDTDIDSGLEYLPESTKELKCSVDERKNAKCKDIYNLLANDQGVVETKYGWIISFPQKLQTYKQKLQIRPQIEQTLTTEEITPDQLTQQLAKNNYLTDFANTWQKYLDTAQTPGELNIRKEKILAAIENLKSEVVGEQQPQILQPNS